jgi:hypothetical protein
LNANETIWSFLVTRKLPGGSEEKKEGSGDQK